MGSCSNPPKSGFICSLSQSSARLSGCDHHVTAPTDLLTSAFTHKNICCSNVILHTGGGRRKGGREIKRGEETPNNQTNTEGTLLAVFFVCFVSHPHTSPSLISLFFRCYNCCFFFQYFHRSPSQNLSFFLFKEHYVPISQRHISAFKMLKHEDLFYMFLLEHNICMNELILLCLIYLCSIVQKPFKIT